MDVIVKLSEVDEEYLSLCATVREKFLERSYGTGLEFNQKQGVRIHHHANHVLPKIEELVRSAFDSINRSLGVIERKKFQALGVAEIYVRVSMRYCESQVLHFDKLGSGLVVISLQESVSSGGSLCWLRSIRPPWNLQTLNSKFLPRSFLSFFSDEVGSIAFLRTGDVLHGRSLGSQFYRIDLMVALEENCAQETVASFLRSEQEIKKICGSRSVQLIKDDVFTTIIANIWISILYAVKLAVRGIMDARNLRS
mgnify:CR=1 FL=1